MSLSTKPADEGLPCIPQTVHTSAGLEDGMGQRLCDPLLPVHLTNEIIIFQIINCMCHMKQGPKIFDAACQCAAQARSMDNCLITNPGCLACNLPFMACISWHLAYNGMT